MTDTPELHTILVWLQGQQGVTQYVFRSRDTAEKSFARASNALVELHTPRADAVFIEISDDYGRELFVPASSVVALQHIDVASELNGQAELRILQEHANVKLQRRAQQDPLLNGRPAIVPAGMNGPLPFPPRGN